MDTPDTPPGLQERYRTIFETAGVGLWEEDYSLVKRELDSLQAGGVTDFRAHFAANPLEVGRLAGMIRILDANYHALATHGLTSLDELGGSLERISSPASADAFREALIAIAEGKDMFESEVEGRTITGETVYSVISIAIPRKAAAFECLTVSTLDITKRKRAELALKESEDRYRTIFDNAKVSLWEEDFSAIFDEVAPLVGRTPAEIRRHLEANPQWVKECIAKVRILDVNREALRLYKADGKEALLGSLSPFITEDVLPVFRDELVAICEGRAHFEGEQKAINLAGEEMTILVSFAIPREREGFRRVIVSITDITEHKRAEEEELRVQRLESLGVLAGGIAHDFNNLLAAILGNISLLKLEADEVGDPGKGCKDLMEDAEKAILRARGLTQQLLTFSRGGAPLKQLVRLGQLLRESVSFALSGSQVEASLDVSEGLFDCELDEGQFSQVVNNLVINARQAMPRGGVLEVSASNRETPGGGPAVRLVFRDHGAGISPADVPRIFDPYFTTKAGGKGLGLTVVHSIVRRHGGHIEVESEPGKGSAFIIDLPASAERAAAPAAAAPPRVGNLRVLVMDDEDSVRTAAEKLLQRLGCTVLLTEDGEGALEVIERQRSLGEAIDVVIMDLTIPGGMGGAEAVRRLRGRDRTVKAVASSGYSTDPVLSSFAENGFDAVLAKPYSLEELRRVLSAVSGKA